MPFRTVPIYIDNRIRSMTSIDGPSGSPRTVTFAWLNPRLFSEKSQVISHLNHIKSDEISILVYFPQNIPPDRASTFSQDAHDFPKTHPPFLPFGSNVRLQQQLRQFQGDLGLRIPHALPEEKETAELDHVVHGLGLKKKI